MSQLGYNNNRSAFQCAPVIINNNYCTIHCRPQYEEIPLKDGDSLPNFYKMVPRTADAHAYESPTHSGHHYHEIPIRDGAPLPNLYKMVPIRTTGQDACVYENAGAEDVDLKKPPPFYDNL